jgi:hypothetical protein
MDEGIEAQIKRVMENTTKDKWNMGKISQAMNHAHALGPKHERMRAQ